VEENTWIDNRVDDLEISSLQRILACRNQEAVEAAIAYARYLASLGVTPENCPVFLSILEIRNRWVVEALVGKQDPFKMLSAVQPNANLLSHIFRMLADWPKGEISPVNLSVILGALRSIYSTPRNGYNLYPISLAELNSLGKHLDKDKGQDNPVNRAILDCLYKLSSLENPSDPAMDQISSQALAIRNAFFDERRRMQDVIPEVLLGRKERRQEIEPRREAAFSEGMAKPAAKAAPPQKAAGRPSRRTAAKRR